MPAGTEVYDSSFNLIFRGTDRLVRFIGFTTLGKVNGSVTDARFLNGTPVVVFQMESAEDTLPPTISYTSTGFSWSYGSISAPLRADGCAYYGVF